jgi:hypothetical protein
VPLLLFPFLFLSEPQLPSSPTPADGGPCGGVPHSINEQHLASTWGSSPMSSGSWRLGERRRAPPSSHQRHPAP